METSAWLDLPPDQATEILFSGILNAASVKVV